MTYTATLPILGFDGIETYRLEKIDDFFYSLKNAEGDTPTFTLIHPAAVREDYAFDLPAAAAEKLALTDEKDALVLNIMTLDTPLEKSHINFIAPLVFNTKNRTMAQVVLDAFQYPDYGVAEPLAQYLAKVESS